MSNGLKCSILNLKKSILFYFSYFLNLSVIFEYEILISCVQNLDDHVMSDKYNFILTTLWWILFGLFLILVGWNYWLLELDIIFLYMLWTSKLMPKSCFLKVTRTRIYFFLENKGAGLLCEHSPSLLTMLENFQLFFNIDEMRKIENMETGGFGYLLLLILLRRVVQREFLFSLPPFPCCLFFEDKICVKMQKLRLGPGFSSSLYMEIVFYFWEWKKLEHYVSLSVPAPFLFEK